MIWDQMSELSYHVYCCAWICSMYCQDSHGWDNNYELSTACEHGMVFW